MPGNIRGRFTSRQTIVSTPVAMVAGFAIGGFIDDFGSAGKRVRFHIVFAVRAIFGWFRYIRLSRATYIDGTRQTRATKGTASPSWSPFRNGSCLRAVLFFGFWTSD